jgi:hypothetical protein
VPGHQMLMHVTESIGSGCGISSLRTFVLRSHAIDFVSKPLKLRWIKSGDSIGVIVSAP